MSKIYPEENKKLCSICNIVKDVIEFHKCSRGGVQSACKLCRSGYQRRLTREKILKTREIIPIINLDGEIWRVIAEYPNYEISNFGRIKILERSHGKSCYNDKIKKQRIDDNGYNTITLSNNGKLSKFSVHRLVAKAFIPNPNNLPTVHHMDHNRLNNHISNLEWATVSDNCSDAVRENVYTKRNPRPKLKFQYKQVPPFLNDYNICLVDEIWKDINNKYQVSNYGRVRNTKTLKLRKQQHNSDDYLENGIEGMGRKPVHRLVAIAFIPNPENKPQVNHISGNKFDNRVENLEWSTAKDNVNHAIQMGLRTVGEYHGFAKLKEKEVLEIKQLYKDGLSINKIRKMFGVSHKTIGNIIKRRTWVHL